MCSVVFTRAAQPLHNRPVWRRTILSGTNLESVHCVLACKFISRVFLTLRQQYNMSNTGSFPTNFSKGRWSFNVGVWSPSGGGAVLKASCATREPVAAYYAEWAWCTGVSCPNKNLYLKSDSWSGLLDAAFFFFFFRLLPFWLGKGKPPKFC